MLINKGIVIITKIKSIDELISILVMIFFILANSFTRDTISPAFLVVITFKGRLYKCDRKSLFSRQSIFLFK